mgnify:CR=1 FL=1
MHTDKKLMILKKETEGGLYMFLRTKNKRNGRHSRKSKKQLWRGILSAVLCVAFLSTNVGGAFSVAAAETLLGVAEDTQEDTGEG